MNKVEFITKSEYTHRTVSDGIITGIFKTVVHAPKTRNYFSGTVEVLVEHFIGEDGMVLNPQDPDGELIPGKIYYVIESQEIPYKMEEFDAIAVANGISFDTSVDGFKGSQQKAFPLIAEILVKSGGSKQKGTLGVDPADWELVV